MNSFQPVLASCPWIPIIGNHEHNDGDDFNRYLNLTFGQTLGHPVDPNKVRSNADSALGDFLTKTTLFAAGAHGTVPSHTSRYFAVDVGIVHVVGLDLNNLDPKQLDWLDRDLSAVDRTHTPWIIVSSHFPLHHATVDVNPMASAAYYNGDEPERYATSGHEFFPAKCDAQGCEETVGDFQAQNNAALEPLLLKHGVDIYAAGHVHDYCSTYPICKGGVLCKDAKGNEQTNFLNPKGTVHFTEGNGGVPGVKGSSGLAECKTSGPDWCRRHGTGGAYGRITAFNATHLQYEHVQNNGGVVSDTWTIVQNSHGPFSS
jgi:hypothetical protein